MIMTDASITTATMLNARTPRTRTIEHACSPLRTRESFLWAWRRPVFEAKYDGFQDFSCLAAPEIQRLSWLLGLMSCRVRRVRTSQ
jgi:hypothetical protein